MMKFKPGMRCIYKPPFNKEGKVVTLVSFCECGCGLWLAQFLDGSLAQYIRPEYCAIIMPKVGVEEYI
jgi:hypothetical protein